MYLLPPQIAQAGCISAGDSTHEVKVSLCLDQISTATAMHDRYSPEFEHT